MTKKERSEIEMNWKKETASLSIHDHIIRVKKKTKKKKEKKDISDKGSHSEISGIRCFSIRC